MRSLPTFPSGLTVGEVAGLIAGATSVVSHTIPLVVVFLLTWSIAGRRLNAATWSVAARTLQSSDWPTILRADSTNTKFVVWRVYGASVVLMTAAILLFIAHFLTPLPLDSEIALESTLSLVPFQYAPDYTFVGQGTSPRPQETIFRTCGHEYPTVCPSGSILDLLETGSENTIAGPGDIQFRNFEYGNWTNFKGQWVSLGFFRPMQSFLLENSYKLVEGLVIDSVDGGVGLRNHSVPSGLDFGATWSEDLLWIQPETVCATSNFTIQFSIGSNDSMLEDDGAFAWRDWDPPEPRWDIYNENSQWNISASPPNLEQRAYLASWWNNYFTAKALNISRESVLRVGDTYPNTVSKYTSFISPYAISISNMDGSYFDEAWPYNLKKFLSLFVDQLADFEVSNLVPGEAESEAFTRQFSAYGRRCSGYDDTEPANSTKPYIRCGNLYGVPIQDDADGLAFRLGSRWKQPLYTCASAVKASVKTVEFVYNGTSKLSNLTVSRISDKEYADDTELPIWAVENVAPIENLRIEDIDPLWGLLDNSHDISTLPDSISTVKSKEFYLPAAYFGRDLGSFTDSMAAATAFTAAWNSVYQDAAWIAGTTIQGVPSYSGEAQYALFLKWRDLSRSPDGASKILNLIWTDLVASTVVGTKTGFQGQTMASNNASAGLTLGKRLVRKHHTKVVYTNYLFAIPAFLGGALWVILVIFALGVLLSRRMSFHTLKGYMNETSLGRAVYHAENPQSKVATAQTKEWVAEVGKTHLRSMSPSTASHKV